MPVWRVRVYTLSLRFGPLFRPGWEAGEQGLRHPLVRFGHESCVDAQGGCPTTVAEAACHCGDIDARGDQFCCRVVAQIVQVRVDP